MIKKMFNYKNPQNLLILIDIMGILLLYLYKDYFDHLILLFGIGLIFITYGSYYILSKISSGDHYIFLIISILVSIGIIMIYRINPSHGFHQMIWFGISIGAFFITYYIIKKIKGWERWTKVYIVLSIILFLSTLIFGVRIKGATNWIKVGSFGFQPAEGIKILFIFFLASYYVNKDKIKNIYILLGIVYTYIGFLFIQKDLGTAMVFYLIFIVILYIYEEKRMYILYNLLGAFVASLLSYVFVNHVKIRVITWANPWEHINDKGYQITQSLFAIASGGFFGTGLGLGHPEFIPEVHTDFIFSAICEEMGIFGGISIVMLFLILVYRGFKITLNQQNPFFKIVALGITVMFGFQAFIIIAGVIKMIPLTGITLPFVSYGGSSLLSSFIALGILQVASEELDFEQEEDYE